MMLFLEKNKQRILSFIIAVYCLPLHFSRSLPYSFDGGWMTSLNLAIKNHLVFGRDFIFTYGPLGVLSTRCNLYVSNFLFVAADLFFVIGIFHFIYKYITPHRGWFLIALCTMFMFRSAVFSQSLFIVFIMYSSLCLLSNFSSRFEAGYCAATCILLFFIKINYGILTLAGCVVLTLVMLARNYRMLFFFLPFTLVLFTVIYFAVHIDVLPYIKHSITVSQQYDEVGYWPIKFSHTSYISALFLLASVAALVLFYLYRSWKNKTLDINRMLFTGCIGMSCYVLYRNGFTRADPHHYSEFFAALPFVIISVVFLCRLQKGIFSKVVVVFALLVSGYNLMLPDINDKAIRTAYYLSYLSPVEYFKGVFQKRSKDMEPIRKLSDEVVKNTGNTTIDILPWETELLHFYNFNYHPRPVPQTCGYAGPLDSINASFFSNPRRRPGIVMINSFPIDYKYFFWEESLSKAALRLNYNYDGFAGVNGVSSLTEDDFSTYLMLKSRKDVSQLPVFEELETRNVKLDDTVRINYAPGDAIYMTVHFNYNFRGSIRRFLFQPPSLSVFLFLEDGSSREFRAPLPSLKVPVLINKAVLSNVDLKNYFAGDLKNCMNIRSFVFHPATYGFEQEYSVRFMKFRNY